MNDKNTSENIVLNWDCGTGYDFFFSQFVLHNPDVFGLRGPWAAGVRSRLAAKDRKILEEAQNVIVFPIQWLYQLPQPKDSNTVLQALHALPARKRIERLTYSHSRSERVQEVLLDISERGQWNENDRKILKDENKHSFRPVKKIEVWMNWWAAAEDYGESYLQALRSYQEVFFAEEESRIRSFLLNALEGGQARAKEVPWPQLIEELSQGVRLDSLTDLSEFVLVPSYWSTPLIVYDKIDTSGCYLVLFGARPPEFSLVPGEVVPDALLRALKAMADPTRLRILRHLTEEALTPAQLSRLLRLRAPTVIHHLNILRLAGLVRLTLVKEGEKRYEVRAETINSTFTALQKFLDDGENN